MADQFQMKVTNRREIRQAFRRLDADVQKEVQKELRKVAAPVAETARSIASEIGLPESTASGYRPGTSVGIAKVRQTRRKTTGLHSAYGSLQMRKVLIPALQEHAAQIVAEMTAAVNRATGRFNRG